MEEVERVEVWWTPDAVYRQVGPLLERTPLVDFERWPTRWLGKAPLDGLALERKRRQRH